MTRTLLVGLGAAAVLLAACSPDKTDFRDAASGVIEGDLADNLSIDQLDATCDDPSSRDVGTTFTCTATGDIDGDATLDSWSVYDTSREPVNTANDVTT